MSSHPGWLPELILLADYGGDWTRFDTAVYDRFRSDLVRNRPRAVLGVRFAIRSRLVDGREETFWHLTSEGAVEEERTPDLRRCERIGWPRPIIIAAPATNLCCWRNSHRGQARLVVAIDDFSYVVILADRQDYMLLLTAYCVEEPHRRRKLAKEFDFATKDGAAL